MRLLKIGLIVAFCPVVVMAQGVTEGDVKMGKDTRWCFTNNYNYDKGAVKEVLEQELDAAGLERSGHKKGVYTYKAATWKAISPTRGDYYYKVKGKKGHTAVMLSASKGYDNYVTSANDSATANRIKRFMTELDHKIDLSIRMKEKQEEMEKLAAKKKSMEKDLKKVDDAEAKKASELKAMQRQSSPAQVK